MIKARALRRYSNTGVYHIILRGIDKQDIFYDDQDRNVFKKIIKITSDIYKYKVYCYCLMNNHIHLVIRIKDNFLSKGIQSIEIRYLRYFNKKYERTGGLFEDRFKSKTVENKEYFLNLCRYVHRNPEKALIEKVENYKWSSYIEYIGTEELIDKSVLLYYFENNIEEFKKFTHSNLYDNIHYVEFEIMKAISDEELINLILQELKIKDLNELIIFDKKQKEEKLKIIKKLGIKNVAQVSRVTKINKRIVKRILCDN